MTHDEGGFTLVETLVAIVLIAILSIGFYQVMFSTVRGASNTQQVAQIAQEARGGLNRMIRDTRAASDLITASATSYRIWTDYDLDRIVDDYEYMQYAYASGQFTITPLTVPAGGSPSSFTGAEATLTGQTAAVLVDHVGQIGTSPVFNYSSNFLTFDANSDGQVTSAELDTASGLGNNNGLVDGLELKYVSDIAYSFTVTVSTRSTNFYGQADLRNRRYSNL
jgi:prepilin-type N-terminal cleavage/methylation domain-containing protein